MFSVAYLFLMELLSIMILFGSMSCIAALRARILPGHEPLPSATKEFKRRLWFTSLQVLLNCWWSLRDRSGPGLWVGRMPPPTC